MGSCIRIIVVGAGFMGHNHARVVSNTQGVQLVGIVDTNEAKGTDLAHQHSVPWQPTIDGIVADAAIIATPTESHHQNTISALQAGMHVLVEKPIAASAIHARDMIDTARRLDRVLQVGHIERFNPAFIQLQQIVTKTPITASYRRYSPHPQRITDGVVHDMMIHDVDLALAMFGSSQVDDVIARSVVGASGVAEITTAVVSFASGAIVTLSANRLAQNKVRQIDLTLPEAQFSVDLLRQTISKQSWAAPGLSDGNKPAFQQSAVEEIPYRSVAGEPLQLQLDAFIAACRGTKPVQVTGEHGMNALKLCDWIHHATRI